MDSTTKPEQGSDGKVKNPHAHKVWDDDQFHVLVLGVRGLDPVFGPQRTCHAGSKGYALQKPPSDSAGIPT